MRKNCKTLLPQREPYMLVDVLTRHDDELTVTETRVRADNMLVERGRLSVAGLVENMSQSCAARIGYINKYIRKGGLSRGVVASMSGLQVYELPRVDETIVTRVRVGCELEDMLMAAVETVAKHDGRLLMKAEKIVLIS